MKLENGENWECWKRQKQHDLLLLDLVALRLNGLLKITWIPQPQFSPFLSLTIVPLRCFNQVHCQIIRRRGGLFPFHFLEVAIWNSSHCLYSPSLCLVRFWQCGLLIGFPHHHHHVFRTDMSPHVWIMLLKISCLIIEHTLEVPLSVVSSVAVSLENYGRRGNCSNNVNEFDVSLICEEGLVIKNQYLLALTKMWWLAWGLMINVISDLVYFQRRTCCRKLLCQGCNANKQCKDKK